MRNPAPAFLALVLCGCVSETALDKSRTEVGQLQAKVAALEKVNADQRQRIGELDAAGNQMKTQLEAAEKKLSQKPEMPVQVAFRKAFLGTGYVAVFNTTIKQDFPVLVTIKSKALGTSKQFQVNLSRSGSAELGAGEGAIFYPQDELILENINYERAKYLFQY